MATRSLLSILLDDILSINNIYRDYASTRRLSVVPYGNYSGAVPYTLSSDNNIVTNPWSVPAHLRNPPRHGELNREPSYKLGNVNVYLKPGQSYNFATGQLSDPSIHNKTAARLNAQVNEMKVNEAGLSQVFQESARQGKSVLATVDELYWGDIRTSASQGSELGVMKQAEQAGYNTGGGKTILGKTNPPTPAVVAKTKRRSF